MRTWDEVDIFPYSTDCLRRLKEAGFSLFVVTNQAVVGRGQMRLDVIESLHQRIMAAVDPEGFVSESFLCPHAPEENCDCRKPLPGSLLRAADKYDIDLTGSFMVGDAVTDIEAGRAAGVSPIMVLTGRGRTESELLPDGAATIVRSLVEATELILSR